MRPRTISCFASTSVKQEQTNATGTLCKLSNPYQLEGPVAANFTVYPIMELLPGSYIGNVIAYGLNKLQYEIKFNPLLLTLKFEVSLGHADIYGDFIAKGYLDASPLSSKTFPSGMFIGSGRGKISTDNFHINGSATLEVNIIKKHVLVSHLQLEDISFSKAMVYLGDNFNIGGEFVNWEEFNSNFKQNFGHDWATNEAAITEKIRLAASYISEKHTTQEFFDFLGVLFNNGKDCLPKTASEIVLKIITDAFVSWMDEAVDKYLNSK